MLEAGIRGKVRLEFNLGDGLTSRQDMGVPISPDDEGNLLCVPDE